MIGSSPEFPAYCFDQSNYFALALQIPDASPRRPGILVVDDDAAVRLLLDVGLRRYGFAVWQAAHGQEALQVYCQEGFAIDLVLLDVRMPILDGPQTLAALVQLNPHLRCCFMTGQAGQYSEEQLLALGAVCVFQKPFQIAEMAQTFAQLIGSSPGRP